MTKVVRKLDFGAKGRHVAASRRGPATGGSAPAEPAEADVGRVPRISVLMALAIRFDGLLRDGTVPNLTELARLAHVTQPRMTQIMNLLHLAPDIQEALLFLPSVRGRDECVSERDLRKVASRPRWCQQRSHVHRLGVEVAPLAISSTPGCTRTPSRRGQRPGAACT
jgi:hypothetical protein